MAFKNMQRATAAVESPEALFRDLRNRKIPGLLAHQADILRNYYQVAMKGKDLALLPDVALQMPTGSGKTLVGLLIGEWRRRRFGQKVAYLCPTVQLVNQVVAQGQDYGIRAVALTGKQSKYPPASKSEYLNSEAVAVTTYSALFNTNSFYDSADTLLLDDAHAGENYVADYWSLSIERWGKEAQPVLFDAVVGALNGLISHEGYARLRTSSPSPSDRAWTDKIPLPLLTPPVMHTLVGLLDEHVQGTNLQYPQGRKVA